MSKKGPKKHDPDNRTHWCHNDVLNLVEKIGENWSDFNSGVRKKKFIWKDIAAGLADQGFHVSGEECDRKWRNLKIRYLTVLEKQLNGDKVAHRIDYFDHIHSFLKDDPLVLNYLEQRARQDNGDTQRTKSVEMDLTQDRQDSPGVLSRSTSTISLQSVGSATSEPEGGETGPASDSAQPVASGDKSRDHITTFFKCDADNNTATCVKCGSKLKIQSTSNYNLKKHYRSKHPTLEPEFLAALSVGSKRGRHQSGTGYSGTGSTRLMPEVKRRQLNTEAALKPEFSQKEALDLYYRFFVCDMMPSIQTDSDQFRKFLHYMNPEFKVPSRRKLVRDIQRMGEETKVDLMDVLAQQDYVATTADSWSSHNRSFLGMTVTWLDKKTLERHGAVLGVKELKQAQTAEFLADAMSEVHHEFGIQRKVVATTTDSGANYVSTFNKFGTEQEEEQEEDYDLVQSTIRQVQVMLENDPVSSALLPKHRRCGAHTVNLLASSDTQNVPAWSGGGRAAFTKPAAKAQGIWNAQNRKIVMANDIKAALGRKLPTPGVTSWNSSFDAYKELSSQVSDKDKLTKLNQICQRQHPHPLPIITEEDIEIWSEYVKVMTPLAICLDKLQAEDNAYMGCLLPNLMVMKDALLKLKQDDNNRLRHANNLVDYLLDQNTCPREGPKGFQKRFGHLFADMDLLVATAVHPQFKPPTVSYLVQQNEALLDEVKSCLVDELVQKIHPEATPGSQETEEMQQQLDTAYMWASQNPADVKVQANLKEKVTEEVNRWSKIKPTGEKPSPHLFPHEFRETWVAVFLKYNTPLPSSASVERLFSFGSDVLKPKKSSLTAHNFEHLVFMKGNLKTLKKLQEEEEED